MLGGLEEGVYYIEKLTNANQIKLYSSRSFIPVSNNLQFTSGNLEVPVKHGDTAFATVETSNIGAGGTLTGNLTITNGGSGDTNSNPSITLVGGGTSASTTGLTITPTITGNAITSMVSGGSSFTSPPTVSISAPTVAVGVNTIKLNGVDGIEIDDTLIIQILVVTGITITGVDTSTNILTMSGVTIFFDTHRSKGNNIWET